MQERETIHDLERRVATLKKINDALMSRVERSMDHHANAYSMFQTAIGLENQVRVRTEELNLALARLERLNDQLTLARDAAEQADRFKTRFFTAVGHDLLQPLHAARLSLSALSDGADGDVRSMRLVGQIDHSLSTIEELLRTILDLSKLEAGVMRPSLQDVHLSDLFQTLVLDFSPLAQARSLEISASARDLVVNSDPLMLRRILQNLVANALQYTDLGRVLLSARMRGSFVRLDVWDTGPGIADSEQQKIFEEFHRGAAGERSRGGGFGIGLAIMARMSNALGHPVEICTRIGKGSRFSVYAPFVARTVRPAGPTLSPAAKASKAYGFGAIKALLVDNDEAVLQAMSDLLLGWGGETRTASSPEDVAEILANEGDFRPDIVLADFHLDHGQCGLDVIAMVRARWGNETAAIVITADHSDEVAQSLQDADCDVLRKPVKPAELRALVLHLLK